MEDVLEYMLVNFYKNWEDAYKIKTISKLWKKVIDKLELTFASAEFTHRAFMKKKEWKRKRCEMYKELMTKEYGILYLGYHYTILHENYKFDLSKRISIKAKIHYKNIDNLQKVGLVYTWNEWKDVIFWEGPSYRKNNKKTHIYPNIDNYICDPCLKKIKGECGCRKKDFYRDEEKWFYNKSNNGLIMENTNIVEFTLTIDISMRMMGRFSRKKLWLALYIEDKNGNKYWDNNGGWNYEIKTTNVHDKEDILDFFDAGWQGS